MLDATAMPWMDGIFDSYPDQQWDLSPDAAVFSNVTDQTWAPFAQSPGQTPADFNAGSLSSSSPQTVSDRVLAQHYTQNLASKYSSKGQTWNNHTYFFNRFNSSHSFVISSLYAWTAAHLHCNGTLGSETSALEHYEKSLVALGDQLGVHLEIGGMDEELSQTWPQIITGDDDLDAVSVTLYFLAWTDLLLCRRASLKRMLSLEACLLESRGHGDQSQSVYGRMAVWFCFLDARTALFCQSDDRIIQCLGNDLGLMFSVDKSYNFLQQEYTLLYPNEERRWDEAHRPFITEEKAAENKVLSIFLTANALFHAVHIYASRIYRPQDAIYAETTHAEDIISITRRFYSKLKRPRTEAPPTKIWPIPLIMAAIEAKDPIYRDWALQLIKDCSQAGKHYANACVFVEKVHAAEEGTGCRANLSQIAQEMGDGFVIYTLILSSHLLPFDMPSAETSIMEVPRTSYYQHIVVEGTPYERGLSHGRQVADKVRANIEYYKLPGKLPHWSISSKIIETVYLPAFENLYPTGLEEIRGIADGAGVTIEEVIMLNARYDLGRCMYRLQDGGKMPQELTGHDECTSGFFPPEAVVSGRALAVHNWDMSSHLYNQDLIIYLEVHPDPSEDRPSMFILTEAGQLIRSGMNSAGMSVTANSLLSSEDYVPISHVDEKGVYHEIKDPKPVLPLSVARRVFLEYSNYAEGLVAINAFPRHVSGNLHVSTAEGFAMAMEVSPSRVYKFYGNIDDNYLIHSNHFLSPEFLSRDSVFDRSPGGSTWFRSLRAEKGLLLLKVDLASPTSNLFSLLNHSFRILGSVATPLTMKIFSIALLSFLSTAMAAPLVRGPGGRLVQEGATCTLVQGRSVCDDGFGNTFFEDDPFSSK
ncbi:hypothetical protein FANTH_8135 [Fusarium anthophilum]|uniref:Peptidase C45 hydrolase domain-containing protein n=1 Tax=Fusarium anthophilum TaxID=48485 RepID=A0A8H4ZCF5_9HYPO|nr:hypothetical protein FANTH_8135 [Fusarium anthophilum]